jgi:hypothetical protein
MLERGYLATGSTSRRMIFDTIVSRSTRSLSEYLKIEIGVSLIISERKKLSENSSNFAYEI